MFSILAPEALSFRRMIRLLLGISMAASAAAQGALTPAFEVASLKPSPPGGDMGVVRPAQGGQRYVAERVPLRILISTAYRIKSTQIEGGPKWVDDEFFDMDGRAERPSSMDDLHAMLKNLLAERFHLKFHYVTRQAPIYELTAAGATKNMTPHTAASAGDPTIDRTMEKPLHAKWKMTSVSMDYFAYGLTYVLDRPVIDRTGIKGDYDFGLAYTAELAPGISENTLVKGQPLDLSGPNIFEAVKERLGLQLTPQKGPVQFMVIDAVQKPDPN